MSRFGNTACAFHCPACPRADRAPHAGGAVDEAAVDEAAIHEAAIDEAAIDGAE